MIRVVSAAHASMRLPWLLAALVLLAAVAAGSCASLSFQRELIKETPGELKIERVTGFPAPKDTVYQGEVTLTSVQNSLRRIIVRYHGISSFSLKDPQPLLTDAQIEECAPLLAQEVPKLAPNQRIRIWFRDAMKGNLNEVDVYRDGAYLVYYFNVLVGNPKLALNAGDPPFPEATMDPLTGQNLERRVPDAHVLQDPLPGTRIAQSANVTAAKTIVEENLARKDISPDEAAKLLALVEQRPEVTIQVWRSYWEKRSTLQKAKAQGLMDEAAFQTQLAKIELDLK